MHDRGLGDRVEERAVPRRQFGLFEDPYPQLALAAIEVRRQFLVRPRRPPLVVVRGRTPKQNAGVVGRAAAENPRT
jgi:hypothetical protein